jgi:hypothetical protein
MGSPVVDTINFLMLGIIAVELGLIYIRLGQKK